MVDRKCEKSREPNMEKVSAGLFEMFAGMAKIAIQLKPAGLEPISFSPHLMASAVEKILQEGDGSRSDRYLQEAQRLTAAVLRLFPVINPDSADKL